MEETIHQTIEKYFDWIEEDEHRKNGKQKNGQVQNNQETMVAETMLAIAKYLKYPVSCGYKSRLLGIAQGMLRSCEVHKYFSNAEIELLDNLLK